MSRKVLHLDSNHPLLLEALSQMGFENIENYRDSKAAVEAALYTVEGLVIRSRFAVDKQLIDCLPKLRFIARVGAGLENIDCDYATSKGIALIAAPEGNRTAVAEQALGMLLALMNKLAQVDREVRQGIWIREGNRGFEIEGKTVGIIGYGNMGKAFAQRLQGFDCQVIFHDLLPHLSNAHATQVSLKELQQRADIVSLHTPQTDANYHLVDESFISGFDKPFWFINTARGKSVDTAALVSALESGKILGAGLDVLEYEKTSFESLFSDGLLPEPMQYLIRSNKVLLAPHIAGWTVESKVKLAEVIAAKIKAFYAV